MFFSISDVYNSAWSADETGGELETPTLYVRRAGDTDGSTGEGVECWDGPCVVYRPAAPQGGEACQVLTMEAGARPVVVGGRDVRLVRAAGALNEGDVAIVGWGAGKVLLKASGAVTLFQQVTGRTDAYLGIDDDGAITIGNQWGSLSISDEGIVLSLASGEQLVLTQGLATLLADLVEVAGGGVKLGVSAAVPLAAVPTVIGTGTPTAGFVAAKPVPNVLV